MGSTGENKTIPMEEAEEEEACLFAMQLASISVLPMVLKSAIELDLLETISKLASPGGYVSSSEIAAHIPTKNPDAPVMVDRILRVLASYSVVKFSARELPGGGGVERLYGLAPMCKFLTKNDDGVSMAPLLLMSGDKVHMESWYYLKDAVFDGRIPFNKAYGMTVFEYSSTDLRFSKVFNLGMSNPTTIIMKKILETYKGFDGLTTLVDVGGGIGATLIMIVAKHPTIKGINFDLPHVVEDAPSYPGRHFSLAIGIQLIGQNKPFGSWICHDWSDEHCLKLLKSCYKALPDNGKVIIAELILPEVPDTKIATQIAIAVDAIMLANTPDGKERTEKEFEALAKGAGFAV
ncbi:unnamed protein product [Camellia sinensis]